MGLSFIAAQAREVAPKPYPTEGLDPSVAQAAPPAPAAPEGLADQLLTFIHTLADWVGYFFVEYVLKNLLPVDNPAVLDPLGGPIGYMLLLTVFLIIAEVAKKIAWIVVVVGWILIVIRIVLEMIPPGGVPA